MRRLFITTSGVAFIALTLGVSTAVNAHADDQGNPTIAVVGAWPAIRRIPRSISAPEPPAPASRGQCRQRSSQPTHKLSSA